MSVHPFTAQLSGVYLPDGQRPTADCLGLEHQAINLSHSAEANLVRDQADRHRAWQRYGQDGTRRDRGTFARP
ncbi:MAG: hypothetical protein AAGG72_07440, partial [Pseudomonadota bacterium]